MNTAAVSRTHVIQRFIDLRCYKTYLEIGYGDGKNFEMVSVAVKHAVDPYVIGNSNVIAKTSDRFFEEAAAVGAKYDVIFIDGLHTHEQVARDHENALRCLKTNGVILLHDVNPTLPTHVRKLAEAEAAEDIGPWTGDAYKAWTQIRRASTFWTATIVDDFGVGIVDSSRVGERVNFDPPVSFEEFEASRNRFLRPISLDEIDRLDLKIGSLE
jgi:Methyltransferase domain